MAQFKVTAPAVVAKVEDARREVYFYRGAVLPDIVSEAEKRRLVAVGLVAEVEDPTPADEPKPDKKKAEVASVKVTVAPSSSLDGLNLAELRAFAAEHNIELNGARTKDEIRAVITAASQPEQQQD